MLVELDSHLCIPVHGLEPVYGVEEVESGQKEVARELLVLVESAAGVHDEGEHDHREVLGHQASFKHR